MADRNHFVTDPVVTGFMRLMRHLPADRTDDALPLAGVDYEHKRAREILEKLDRGELDPSLAADLMLDWSFPRRW